MLDMAKDGSIPGTDYQAFRVDRLKRLEDSYRQNSPSSPGCSGTSGRRWKALQAVLWRRGCCGAEGMNRQYANRKAAEKALAQVEGSKGNVRPASLWPIVNHKGRQHGEMRDLARLGQG